MSNLTRLAIELTKLCNLRCIMCLHHGQLDRGQADSHPDHIDLSFFKSIIDQFVIMNDKPKYVCPQYQGESLLYPHFLEACNYLEQNGVFINLTTNAILLTHELSDAILQLNHFYNMAFSIDGYTKETYEKIRLGANYDHILSNINYFMDESRNMGRKIDIYVNMVLMKENQHEYIDFINYWLEKGVRVQITKCTQEDGTILEQDHYWKPKRFPCSTLQYSAIILTNGDIVPCCRDHLYEMVTGNLHEQSLEQIWNGPYYNMLRDFHGCYKFDQLELCSNCSTWMSEIPESEYYMKMLADNIMIKQGPFWEWFERIG